MRMRPQAGRAPSSADARRASASRSCPIPRLSTSRLLRLRRRHRGVRPLGARALARRRLARLSSRRAGARHGGGAPASRDDHPRISRGRPCARLRRQLRRPPHPCACREPARVPHPQPAGSVSLARSRPAWSEATHDRRSKATSEDASIRQAFHSHLPAVPQPLRGRAHSCNSIRRIPHGHTRSNESLRPELARHH